MSEYGERSIEDIAADLFKFSNYLDSKDRMTLYAILIQLGYPVQVIVQLLDPKACTLLEVQREVARVDSLVVNRRQFLELLCTLETKIPANQQEDTEYFQTPINHHHQPPLYRMKRKGHKTFHGGHGYNRPH